MKLRRIIFLILMIVVSINYVDAKELDCNSTLRRGSRGNSVKVLQKRLNAVTDCNLVVDGIFGKGTYACVVKFQDEYGLSTDGVVGYKTCSMLNSDIEEFDEYSDVEIQDGNYLIVVDDDSKVYSSSSNTSSVIEKASFGKIYEYISHSKSWYKIITDDGSYGYIKTSKIRTTFIMVDISEQRLIYFKHNELIIDTNVVTGMKNSHDTPIGYYMLRKYNKERNRTLRGRNDNGTKYEAYVDYWMPFITDRGIGFHDADWRSGDEFGGSTYIYDGSHGCVNMPHSAAKNLYRAITYDEDVIIRK